MKQRQSNRYSIAWFKIAEYVSRGEKERALGVYRLLSHSLHDQALTCQLEADILLACDDQPRAIEKYTQAANIYAQEQRYLQAAAVYEHLILLDPAGAWHHQLVKTQVIIKRYDRACFHAQSIVVQYVQENKLSEALTFIARSQIPAVFQTLLYALSIITIVNEAIMSDGEKMSLIATIIKLVNNFNNDECVATLHKELANIPTRWYDYCKQQYTMSASQR